MAAPQHHKEESDCAQHAASKKFEGNHVGVAVCSVAGGEPSVRGRRGGGRIGGQVRYRKRLGLPSDPVSSLARRAIPNIVTSSRLVLAVGLFGLLGWSSEGPGPNLGVLACVIFAVAAASDALDGYLARRWAVVSPFGRVMDPFCDKFLILGALILLVASPLSPRSAVQPWMVLAIFGRELLITSLRAVAESLGHPFPAESSGKWKMALQCVAIGTSIVAATRSPESVAWTDAARWSMWAATAFTLFTLVPYLSRGTALLSRKDKVAS